MARVAIVMGSDSDLPVVKGAINRLTEFGVDYEAHVISAHRTPYLAEEFAKNAKSNGVKAVSYTHLNFKKIKISEFNLNFWSF